MESIDETPPIASTSKLELSPLTQADVPGEGEDSAAQDLESRRQTQLRKQIRFTRASIIIPPENFAIVEDGLYRSVST